MSNYIDQTLHFLTLVILQTAVTTVKHQKFILRIFRAEIKQKVKHLNSIFEINERRIDKIICSYRAGTEVI